MENVVLVIHLILALCLIGIVLLQRSEGGGLGMGGGGGGAVSSRSIATALGKLTWVFAIAFIVTSIALTVMAARNSASGSVVDRLGAVPASRHEAADPPTPEEVLPPGVTETPLTQPPAE